MKCLHIICWLLLMVDPFSLFCHFSTVPEVIMLVLVRTALNHFQTLSPALKLAFTGLGGCVRPQVGLQGGYTYEVKIMADDSEL